nr:class I adenylate-forming enzyme family protein [Flexivirga oryzae]
MTRSDGIDAALRYAALRHGSCPAVTDDTRSVTYADIARRVANLTRGLRDTTHPGERAGVLIGNDVDAVALLCAASRLRLSVWPVDARQPAPAVAQLAVDHDLSVLFGTAVVSAFGETVWDSDGFQLIRRAPPPHRPDGHTLVVLTGGTTGVPKAAGRRLSATTMWAQFCALVDDVGLARGGSSYIAAPLHHGFGLGALLTGMMLGTNTRLSARFDPGTVGRTIRNHRPEVLVAVPTVLRRLLADDARALTGVHTVVSGSAPLDADLLQAVRTGSDAQLFHLFGTSEGAFCALATPDMLRTAPGTIGRPIPGVRIRVVDGQQAEAADGVIGGLQVRNRAAIARGWVPTGDLAHRDAAGLLHLDGRCDDIAQSGGVSVAPAELERVLRTHGAVRDCAVVPVEDTELGHRLAAFVVAEPGTVLDTDEVVHWLRDRVAHALLPRQVRTVTALPLTPAHKVDRQALSELARQRD